jgi:branched-chain amino acid transport system substrate-binding protein
VVDRFVPEPKVRSMDNRATTKNIKEVDELKKIVFLIIASLLVLGLILPGCAGEGGGGNGGEEEVVWSFSTGKIRVGIANDMGTAAGDMAWAGAGIAAGMINAMGGVNVGGHVCNISLVKIDTDELTDLSGISGKLAIIANLNSCDLFMGGIRTESVIVYRDEVMDAKKLFFDCGAATETLQQSVVVNYPKYKYWFKSTPYNEHFLGMNVIKLIDTVARELRVQKGLAANATLTACIIAENLKWAKDEQVPTIVAGLPGIDVTHQATYLVSSTVAAETNNAVAWAVGNYTPDIIIPLYSGTMGVVYCGALLGYNAANVTDTMSIGINVYAQFKAPWAAGLANPNPGAGAYVAYNCHLDTWCDGLNQTPMTYPFFSTFVGVVGDYPMYTAGTYDALFVLKAAIAAKGWSNAGVGAVNASDIIPYLENPANAIPVTTGSPCTYQVAGTTTGGKPALTSAQVAALNVMPAGWVYNVNDWTMPIHTTHDLVYGIGRATGLGAQWQWTGAVWKKVGIWPRVIAGADLKDQYGDWNFAYPGTQNISIPSFVLDGHL